MFNHFFNFFIVNIFVAKMSSATTSDDLETLFGEHGHVTSAKVIMDKETGHSKCFGFVEMEDETEGMNAINALNETDFQGRKIVVKKAHPREEGENRTHRAFSPHGSERRFNPNR
jgi:RNA recognition motif-containing protein